MLKHTWGFGPFTLFRGSGWGCFTFSLSPPHSKVWPLGRTWGWGWGPFVQRLGFESYTVHGVLRDPLPIVWRTVFTLYSFGFFRRVQTWAHAPDCYRTDPNAAEQIRRGCGACPMQVPCSDWWTGGPFGPVAANETSVS